MAIKSKKAQAAIDRIEALARLNRNVAESGRQSAVVTERRRHRAEAYEIAAEIVQSEFGG